MRIFEIIFVAIFMVGLFFKTFVLPGGAVFMLFSLTILSLFYLLFSFCFFNNIKLKKIFKKEAYSSTSPLKLIGTIGFGFGLSTFVIGILYVFWQWPGGDMSLLTGFIIVTIVTVVALIKYIKTKSKYYFPIFIRYLFWTGIALIAWFVEFKTYVIK